MHHTSKYICKLVPSHRLLKPYLTQQNRRADFVQVNNSPCVQLYEGNYPQREKLLCSVAGCTVFSHMNPWGWTLLAPTSRFFYGLLVCGSLPIVMCSSIASCKATNTTPMWLALTVQRPRLLVVSPPGQSPEPTQSFNPQALCPSLWITVHIIIHTGLC